MTIRALMMLTALSSTLALVACDDQAEQPAAPAPEKDTADTEAPAADKEAKADPHAAFTDLSPEKVDAMLAAKECVPVDANGDKTRSEYGILPGAVLLSDYKAFDASELPDDKSTKLVFYCGGQACTAAPKAAKVAQQAGYADVNVMRAGIRGWVKDGRKVDKPST